MFELVADWLFSEPMAGLLAAFGERLPAAGPVDDGGGGDITGWLHLNEKLPDWPER